MSKPVGRPDSYVVHTLDFYNPPRDSLHQSLKGAEVLLLGALAERGRRLGEFIVEYPSADLRKPRDRRHEIQVELSGPELPQRPTDLRFALDWKAEEMVHIQG